jgi:cytochrome c-type biogenesis protein CcmH/NrfG
MRFLLCIILLAVRSGQASDAPQSWSDWLSEGKALLSMGHYSAAAQAFRRALTG